MVLLRVAVGILVVCVANSIMIASSNSIVFSLAMNWALSFIYVKLHNQMGMLRVQ